MSEEIDEERDRDNAAADAEESGKGADDQADQQGREEGVAAFSPFWRRRLKVHAQADADLHYPH